MANYILIQRMELTQSAASVTFSNIPQSGYTDLKIVMSVRGDSSSSSTVLTTFNGSSANMSFKYLWGSGSTTGSGGSSSNSIAYLNSSSSTASTFSNIEMYIPNYTGSNYKSFSVDGVTENNATTTYSGFFANLWSQIAAITSVGFVPDAGNFAQYSTFSLYGIAATGTTPVTYPKATGGNITTDGTYWYHTFLSTGVFTPQQTLSCDVLTIAGGGGAMAGGGGAGGLVYASSNSLTATSYTVTVGAGGAKGIPDNSGSQGTNSQFGALTAAVGGGYGAGGGVGQVTGGNGGSGGGAGAAQGSTTVTASGGTGSQGNNGGAVSNVSRAGGGGGGASAAGTAATTNSVAGNGGNGSTAYSSWGSATSTGENVGGTYYYAGGGAGGAQTTAGSKGYGGGGTGGTDAVVATAGTANTGGGGGGGRGYAGSQGMTGGSGIVIVRYAV